MEAKSHDQDGVTDVAPANPSQREVEDESSGESCNEDNLECVKSASSSRRTSRIEERLPPQMEQGLAGAVKELK